MYSKQALLWKVRQYSLIYRLKWFLLMWGASCGFLFGGVGVSVIVENGLTGSL